MTPKGKMRKLIHDLRLETNVEHILRKTAHDLSDQDAIILTREVLKEILDGHQIDIEIKESIIWELWK